MILVDDLSRTNIMIGLEKSRNSHRYHETNTDYEHCQSITKHPGKNQEGGTKNEKTKSRLYWKTNSHIFILPLYGKEIQESVSDASCEDNKEYWIEEKWKYVEKEDETGWFCASHEWTLKNFRKVRIESTDNKKMKKGSSYNSG